ncbi:MAG: arginase family protein [Thermoleophilaceae bacterium]|nr:arginase family protein [Thermoleophilaceae bacterium]
MAVLTLLGVPTSAGAFTPGQEKAPAALREAGLAAALKQRGVELRDLGDSPVWRWRPDRERPRAQNLGAVAGGARETAARVEQAIADGGLPLLVLGGDCTIELGVVAGHLALDGDVGLVYFDLHPDLNTPSSVTEGTFDWMGMAHALGVDGAEPELAGIGPREPLLHADQVLFFSYGPERARPFELELMVRRGLAGIPLDEVAAAPEASAERVLSEFASRFDRLLVHFDVDVVDFNDAQLSEDALRGDGLTLDTAMRALKVLSASERLSTLTVTELNPLHGDEEGETLSGFVELLADSLAASPLLRSA